MTDLELAYQTLKKALENDEYLSTWADSLMQRLNQADYLCAKRVLALVFENDAPPPPPLSLPEHAAQLNSGHTFRRLALSKPGETSRIYTNICTACGRTSTQLFTEKVTLELPEEAHCTGHISNLDRVLLERVLSK